MDDLHGPLKHPNHAELSKPEPHPHQSAFDDFLDRKLYDHLPDILIILNSHNDIVLWNQQAETVLGYPRDQAVGQSLEALLASDAVTRQTLSMMQSQLLESQYWEGEIAYNQPDGKRNWCFVRATPLVVAANGANWSGTLIVGATLREHEIRHHVSQAILDYSQRELNSILSSVGDMICSYDVHNQSLYFISPSCYPLTGYTEYDMMDNPGLFLDMVHPDYRQGVRDAMTGIQLDQTVKLEYPLYRKDGSERWVLNIMTPVIDAEAETSRVICVVTDTTAYRELDELRSRMIRMASHDLNNPLSTATGFFNLLASDLDSQLTPEQVEIVDTIQRSHQRMATMLEELLDLEQLVTQDILKLELVDLLPLIQLVLDEFAPQFNEKSHALTVEKPDTGLTIKAEPVQLRHAISNYVSNAIKYTPAEGQIIVRAYGSGARIVFEVQDNGYGVPPQHRDNLFTAFFRAKQSGTEHIPGTGLGLSLIKSVVNHHRGDVFYRPAPTGGSIFGFWLPNPLMR
ncbi:MAG: PAS domain S-box protein [Chloroflexi bacterium]|nr:PAS domain S-box protein [Chloroflexota bacterium]